MVDSSRPQTDDWFEDDALDSASETVDNWLAGLHITVQLRPGRKVEVRGLTDIDEANLNNEFAAQASRFAYIAVLCAEARAIRDTAEHSMDREEADAFIHYKNSEEHVPHGSRTVTDGLAAKLVDMDEEVLRVRSVYRDAERHFRLLEAMTRALAQRADMLQSLGAQLRQEADMTNMHTSADPGVGARRALRSRLAE